MSNPKSAAGVLIAVIALMIGFGAYWAALGAAQIPPMPRARIKTTESAHYMGEIERRAVRFSPSQSERVLMTTLEKIHILETSGRKSDPEGVELKRALATFGELAAPLAKSPPERYLLLGDHLALSFHRALSDVLAELQAGNQVVLAPEGSAELARLRSCGGSFFARALSAGIISKDGVVNAPSVLPLVLFEVRWRKMANLAPLGGLPDLAKRVYFDFLVAFSKASGVRRRLQAADQLSKLEPRFDADVAKALILRDAGDVPAARAQLQTAIDRGRGSRVIKRFLRALSPSAGSE